MVSLREEIRLLSVADILESLSREEMEELALHNLDIRLGEGEILFSPEEVGERLYIVKEGRIRLYMTGTGGREMTLTMVDEGKMFGEMALTAQRLRAVYAQAMQPSLVLSLSREALEDLILRKPRVGLRLAERLSERVRALENRLKDLSFKEVPIRLASLILQIVEEEGIKTDGGYEIPTRYTHEQLAALVVANRVTVSRAFARLRERGIVAQRNRRILVKDLESLGRCAREERRAKRIAERD